MNIQIKYDDIRLLPERTHSTDAGADLKSKESYDLYPGDKKLLDTGVAVKIPQYHVGLVFNRSSQGKIRVVLTNSVGVIDSDYRGNIKVLLANDGEEIYKIESYKTKIAQLVIVPIILANFVDYEDVWDETIRSTGGFGSTGS